MVKSIAINGRLIKEESAIHVRHLLEYLTKKNLNVLISEGFAKANKHQFNLDHFRQYANRIESSQVDCILSLGGDGTLLDTVTHVSNRGVPILGVNTGRLGFLATTSEDAIKEALDQLLAAKFSIEKRTLVQLVNGEKYFDNCNFALNEFAILRKETSSMIVVKVYIDGQFLNTYWADGLMVSTPTGSTGYSLSCGGPIVTPETQTFILTPVSPHNLNIRPLVIPDSKVLSFEVQSRDSHVLISLDSRSVSVKPELSLTLKKADFNISLIKLAGGSFVETLRNKLGWGFDRRN